MQKLQGSWGFGVGFKVWGLGFWGSKPRELQESVVYRFWARVFEGSVVQPTVYLTRN